MVGRSEGFAVRYSLGRVMIPSQLNTSARAKGMAMTTVNSSSTQATAVMATRCQGKPPRSRVAPAIPSVRLSSAAFMAFPSSSAISNALW